MQRMQICFLYNENQTNKQKKKARPGLRDLDRLKKVLRSVFYNFSNI